MEPECVSIFPHPELDQFRTVMFWLTFKRAPHGSGTNLTRGDVLEMEMGEILKWWERLRDAWDAEDRAERKG